MVKALAPLVAMVHQHALLEGPAGDLEGLMATMVDEPLFEFFPLRKQFKGAAEVRSYYEYWFSDFSKCVLSAEQVSESIGSVGVAVEYDMMVLHPGEDSPTKHRIMTILTFGDDRVSGERMYSDDKLFQTMLGPQLARMDPIV